MCAVAVAISRFICIFHPSRSGFGVGYYNLLLWLLVGAGGGVVDNQRLGGRAGETFRISLCLDRPSVTPAKVHTVSGSPET